MSLKSQLTNMRKRLPTLTMRIRTELQNLQRTRLRVYRPDVFGARILQVSPKAFKQPPADPDQSAAFFDGHSEVAAHAH
jgi:hypothetical protein